MKKMILLPLATLALSLPAFAYAQTAPHDPATIQAAGLKDEIGYQIVAEITTEIGARQAGTEAEARARDWAVKKLTALGFDNVINEPFEMPTWVRGAEVAEIISPFPQKLLLTALGNSASTGAQGMVAEIVYFPTLNDLRAVPDGSLQGKIAFVSHNMRRAQDGSGYGVFGAARFVGPQIAAEKGAAAYLVRSVGTDQNRIPHTGNTAFKDVAPIPAAALSIPDAENLQRMIATAKRSGEPVQLKMTLTPQNIGMQTSGNVIAEVTGSDPDAGIIVIACHLDSWDLGTGAIDDASGCGIITAAAHIIKQAGQPRRTIRLLWAGAEEVGVWGGAAYAKRHADDNHVLAMESDFGADKIWRVEFNLPEGSEAVSTAITAALAPMGIQNSALEAGGGADVGAIIAAQNLSVVDLQQDGTYYFDIHHTADDTLDRVDPAAMQQNVAAWATTLSILANTPVSLKKAPE